MEKKNMHCASLCQEMLNKYRFKRGNNQPSVRPGALVGAGRFDDSRLLSAAVLRSELTGHPNSFQTRPQPRMDRNPQCNPLWCIIILISLCTHTESRLVYYQGSGAGSQHPSSRTHSYVQTVGKQQQSAELSVRPRPVVVHCHPDSMEVVVRADMFDSGLEVDAGHLRLGSGPPREVGVCRAEQSGEAEFTIRASLTDCGIQLSVNFLILSAQAHSK